MTNEDKTSNVAAFYNGYRSGIKASKENRKKKKSCSTKGDKAPNMIFHLLMILVWIYWHMLPNRQEDKLLPSLKKFDCISDYRLSAGAMLVEGCSHLQTVKLIHKLASRLTLVQGEVERLSRSHSDATTHETERLHRLRAEFSCLLIVLHKKKSLSLASRLSLVQGEVERLSRSHSDATTHETERLHRLRAEFSHLLRELRKRKSLSEMEPWDVQWRSRRRAMSCSFSRRPSMSVVSLLSTARPASVIETSNHVVSPLPHHLPRYTPPAPPLHSTLAFTDSDGPSTSHTSVFNVNYQSDSSTPSLSSPPSAPKYYQRLSEYSDSGQVCGGLYDEILQALESSEMLYDADRRRCNGTAFRDHIESNFAHAEIRCKSRSNLRKYKSRTMNSVYEKSWSHRWRRPELGDIAERKPRISRSCNHLNGRLLQNTDYEVAIESLSDFATKIRRLSLENTMVDKPHRNAGYSWDVGNSFYQPKKAVDRSRRHSTIPKQQCEECTVSLHHSIYEFV
ncbi:hypothetical protein J6590_084941 [Homalodisca vitripennis]|nr:hypothetical protein J6590_084941 [Homalodisca vitripennis]